MSSSFLQNLRNERDSATSAFYFFLLDYPKTPNGVYAFFEGRDDSSFYTGFILAYVAESGQYHPYRCGNKKGVLEVHSKVMSRVGTSATTLFFVDKDLSNFVGEQLPSSNNVFVTEHYSVENYVVTEAMVRRFCQELLAFPGSGSDLNDVSSRFTRGLQSFHHLMLPIMAWIVWLRRVNLPANLANINLSRVMNLDAELKPVFTVTGNPIRYLEQMCSIATPPIFDTQLPEIVATLSASPAKSYVRGKFELWYLVMFLRRVVELLQTKAKAQGRPLKIRTQISESNAIEVLGPRTDTPEPLSHFLEVNLLRRHGRRANANTVLVWALRFLDFLRSFLRTSTRLLICL